MQVCTLCGLKQFVFQQPRPELYDQHASDDRPFLRLRVLARSSVGLDASTGWNPRQEKWATKSFGPKRWNLSHCVWKHLMELKMSFKLLLSFNILRSITGEFHCDRRRVWATFIWIFWSSLDRNFRSSNRTASSETKSFKNVSSK